MRNLRSVLRPQLASSVPGWIAVVTLLVASAVAAHQAHEAAAATADAVLKREQAEAERAKLARMSTKVSPDHARHWQLLGAEVEFPWKSFFRAIERTASTDIELLEMTPDKARRLIVLRGEARNSAGLLKYVHVLSAQPSLRDVYVSRMQNVERGNLLTVEFEIRMSVI